MSRVKKLGLFFILLFVFICVAIGVLILKIEYFDPYNSVNYSEMIDTEIPKNAKVLDYKDTHGGFLGDGDLYAVIQFDKNEKRSLLLALFFMYIAGRNLRGVAPLALQRAECKPFFPEMLNDGGQAFNRFFVSYAIMHK